MMNERCCNTVFHSHEALESHWTHSLSHAWCTRCSRHFNSWKALEQHTRYSSRHFPCHHCDKSYDFDSYDELLWHWGLSPEHESTYCSWCDLHFNSREARTQHKRDTPGKHQPCWRCNRDFKTKEELEEHWQASEAHQTTYCHVCNQDFNTSHNLREHQRIHIPKKRPCFACSPIAQFATYGDMFIHLESGSCHSGCRISEINSLAADCPGSNAYMIKAYEPWFRAGAPRQVAIFGDFDLERNSWRCPYCQHYSMSMPGLTNHLRERVCATGYPDVLQCPVCSDAFTLLSGLLQHARTRRCSVSTKDGIFARMLAYVRDGLAHRTIRSNVLYELEANPLQPHKLSVRVSLMSMEISNDDRDGSHSVSEATRECRFQSGFAQLVLRESSF